MQTIDVRNKDDPYHRFFRAPLTVNSRFLSWPKSGGDAPLQTWRMTIELGDRVQKKANCAVLLILARHRRTPDKHHEKLRRTPSMHRKRGVRHERKEYRCRPAGRWRSYMGFVWRGSHLQESCTVLPPHQGCIGEARRQQIALSA
ncbi:hypothetical protein P0D68_00060 [Paraburkholderia sp. RL17-380-BIE-A]|uniref:hypothetical protein n=1 Tax=Paraburkholderia sp. RL17-380-BIE-A TaxID=3031630 RepID=UPI0038BC97DD